MAMRRKLIQGRNIRPTTPIPAAKNGPNCEIRILLATDETNMDWSPASRTPIHIRFIGVSSVEQKSIDHFLFLPVQSSLAYRSSSCYGLAAPVQVSGTGANAVTSENDIKNAQIEANDDEAQVDELQEDNTHTHDAGGEKRTQFLVWLEPGWMSAGSWRAESCFPVRCGDGQSEFSHSRLSPGEFARDRRLLGS
jgi:hypothetical protein